MPKFSVDTYADNAFGTLGICNIQNPTYDRANDSVVDGTIPYPSEYNRVYFGWVPETTTGVAKNSSNPTEVDPYTGMKNKPLYWRVLNTTANGKAKQDDEENAPALFMLTEYCLGNNISWDQRSSNNGQKWEFTEGGVTKTDSSLRKFLQGSSCEAEYAGGTAYTGKGVYDECFGIEERTVIMETYNEEISQYYGEDKNPTDRLKWVYNKDGFGDRYAYGQSLNGDKIFLLSAKEVTNDEYGFEGTRVYKAKTGNYDVLARDCNRITKRSTNTGSNSNWWLRSACSYSAAIVARVYSSGYSNYAGSNVTYVAVRFALNIPLSKVIFASDASDVGASPSPQFSSVTPLQRTKFKYTPEEDSTKAIVITTSDSDEPLDPATTYAPGAKLTIASRDGFTLAQSDIYTHAGDTISLRYTGAVTQSAEEAAESAEAGRTDVVGYISALIKDSDSNGLYHARLKAVGDSTTGNVTMVIPQDLPSGDYTLIVYNEVERGEYRTNYAGYASASLHIAARPGSDLNGDYNKALGICYIKSPYNEATSTYSYNYAYFGQKNNDPIHWRVLNARANDFSSTPALFMLTEDCIFEAMQRSAADTFLKDTAYGYFTPQEQFSMLATYNSDGTTNWNNVTMTDVGLTGDKLFLLSAKEASDSKYGQASAVLTASNNWWLRSSVDDTVAYVTSEGAAGNSSNSSDTAAVRFAVNIPLSSILFAQNDSFFSPTPTSFKSVPTTAPTDAKLTIVDNTSARRLFWIPQGKYTASRDAGVATSITLPYRRAATGEGEYISAIIKDPQEEHQYYARLKAVLNKADANGTVTLCIPAELPQGDYTLIMMSEKDNGYRKTNYAKNYNLRLTVDGNKVTITVNGATGACSIMNPKFYDENTPSEYNRVYFGRIPENPQGRAVNALAERNTTVVNPYVNIQDINDQNVDNLISMYDTPIYWRVLNTTANDKLATPALFMLTEYPLQYNISWDMRYYGNGGGQKWEYEKNNEIVTDSSLRMFLQGQSCKAKLSHNFATPYNNSGVYDECFSDREQNAIMETYNGEITQYNPETNILNTEKPTDQLLWYRRTVGVSSENDDNTQTHRAYGCGLNGDKIFLLSTKEVINKNYGFANNRNLGDGSDTDKPIYSDDVNRVTKQFNNSYNSNWFLRSASSGGSNNLACLNYLGACRTAGSRTVDDAVRFALNVPLSKIIFAQDANPSPNPTISSTFSPIASLTQTTITYPDDACATITTVGDSPTSTTIDSTAARGAGSKLTIVDDSREFAVVENIVRGMPGESISVNYSGASIGNDEYICAIIKDTCGNALYHTRLKPVGDNSNGIVSMYIPSDLDCGEYTLVVYNEIERGAYNTNYAGHDTVVLVVRNDNTKPIVTNVYRNGDGTRFKLTASDNWDLYQVTDANGISLRNLANTNVTTNMECGYQTAIAVQDLAGNTTTVNKQDMLVDQTPPSVTVNYDNGAYILTVSDNESGVWKITNRDGSVVYKDFS